MSGFVIREDYIEIDPGTSRTETMWKGYQFGRPDLYSTYFNDFHDYVAGDWTVTETDGAATEALATVAPCTGGVLLVTNTNADNNAVVMQKVGHGFVPTAGKRIYYETRFQASEATQIDLVHGLIVTDTDPVTSFTDGIAFRKDDGDTNLDFLTGASSAYSTDAGIFTFAADTYVKLGFKMTGTGLVEYWINDTKKGSFATNIPTAPLRVTMAIQDGDTAAALGALTKSTDYIFVAQER